MMEILSNPLMWCIVITIIWYAVTYIWANQIGEWE